MNNKNETKCPYRDIIIIIRSGLPTRYCSLFLDEKECIFGSYHDAGECSYYLFPEDTPLYQKLRQEQLKEASSDGN